MLCPWISTGRVMWSKVIQNFHFCKIMVTTVSSKDTIPSVHGCFMLQKAGGPSFCPWLSQHLLPHPTFFQNIFLFSNINPKTSIKQSSRYTLWLGYSSLQLLPWPLPYCWKEDMPFTFPAFYPFPALVQTVVRG